MAYIPPKVPRIPFTRAAYAKLKEERARLLSERVHVLERLKEAREQGDLSENGAYRYAKMELGNIARQVRELTYQLFYGDIVESKHNPTTVSFGTTVTLLNNKNTRTFMLVSEYEANPQQGKLSTKSPMGSAVLGKKKDDVVSVVLPNGVEEYTITSLE